MTITLTREEAQQVLETIGKVFDHNDWQSYETTVDLLRARLAQPEPEPVAWGVDEGEGRCISLHDLYFVKADADHMAELKGTHAKVVPLYTAPPQRVYCSCGDGIVPDDGALCGTCVSLKKMREWQGLTDEEMEAVANSVEYNPLAMTVYEYRVAVQKATAAKLKEKNA